MKKIFPLALLMIFVFSCTKMARKDPVRIDNVKAEPMAKLKYPDTQKGAVVEDYFGTAVADPYRWLEDDNSAETKDWVRRQNEVTFSYLDKIPYRSAIEKRLTEIWNYEKYSTPFKESGKYYFFKNDGLQNHSVLYVQDDLDAEPSVVLDPNTFSEDGTTSLAGFSFSKDGRYLAYGVSEGGSDWRTAMVKDLKTGKTLDDKLQWIKFSSMAWKGNGFYYARYNEPEEGGALSDKTDLHQVYYHKVGTTQADDKLIHKDEENPERNFNINTTEDERFETLYASESTSGNALFFKDTKKGDAEFRPIVETFDHDFWVMDNFGDQLVVMTNHEAPNMRVLLIDSNNPSEKNWKELIPEDEKKLESISLIGGKMLARYIQDASSLVKIFSEKGVYEGDLKLPGIGTVSGFSGKREESTAFYSFTSFTQPSAKYKYDVVTGKTELFKASKIDFNPDDYVTKQVFYDSKDGTKIPMFITHKKGIKLDGNNPTILYGYGGFDISILPSFSIGNIILYENGGIYAVANIRGGGEYGKKWHEAGTKLKKQNVFDDFISAGEYLIANNYTSKEKLAIEGRSNGGLLVGACMQQRPDLFKVAIPGVGVMDMLRYHKFTIGKFWAGDYGTSEESEEQFRNLLGYSPVHNIKAGTAYPATLVITADHDDRVVPAHSFKFAAALQDGHQGENPVLIRIDVNAGHGAGKSTEQTIAERADILSFMFYNFGMNVSY